MTFEGSIAGVPVVYEQSTGILTFLKGIPIERAADAIRGIEFFYKNSGRNAE